jgi:hypothetical protein
MPLDSGLDPSYWQQFHAGNMQMSGMGSVYGGGSPPVMAEGLMGAGMGRAAAFGGPMMAMGMGMMGLDPLTMGMRAGVGAFGRGMGLAGSVGLGAGVGFATAGVGAVAGFAANQIYGGAQQQMALNQGLRQNFTQAGASGTGFSRSDMGQIGGVLRQMTHEFGPAGEVATFGELSRLAQNMGKMGLSTGVRDVQDFSKRFKEMISTLKTVATELGTSLEAAQEFMASSKSSGMFRATDQLRFAGNARSTAIAGNLALSEVTGMANIGSQISRSFGGLGRQGAFAGMKSIGQIGTAVQTGVLSEEDIYNTTGLTGAEGRQAYAADLMQKTGGFLRSGKGRYFMASIAGKDGTLNQEAIDEYMMGTVGVNRTRELAQQNLAGVGRANFIRNEGRLRGSIMEQFGGLAPAIALQGWARDKGIDINNMDDRSMLFAQRHLGMGRDELDSTIKMAQGLPEIMREQRLSKERDSYQQEMGLQRKQQGIEGFKTRMDQIREGIQGRLEKIGADVFQEGSNLIERWFNQLTGQYIKTQNADLDRMAAAIKGGGGKSVLNNYLRNTVSGANVLGISDSAGRAQDAIDEQRVRANEAVADGDVKAFTKTFGGDIMSRYMKGGTGNANDRIAGVGKMLREKAIAGDTDAQVLYARYKSGSAGDRAELASAIEKESGIGGLGDAFEDLKGTGTPTKGDATEMDRYTRMGEKIMGASRGTTRQQNAWGFTRAAGYVVGSVMGGAEAITNLLQGQGLNARHTQGMIEDLSMGAARLAGYGRNTEGVGRYLLSNKGMGELSRIGEGGDVGGLQREVVGLYGGKAFEKLDEETQSLIDVRKKIIASTLLSAELKANGGNLSEDSKKGMLARILKGAQLEGSGATLESIAMDRENLMGITKENREANVREMSRYINRGAKKEATELLDSGFATGSIKDGALSLTKKTREDFKKEGLDVQLGEMAIAASKGVKITGDLDKDEAALAAYTGLEEQLNAKISDLDVPHKIRLATMARGTALGRQAGESAGREQRLRSLTKNAARRGDAGAREVGLAGVLGLDIDKETQKKLGTMSDWDAADELLRRAGGDVMKDGEFRRGIAESITSARKGLAGKAADQLDRALQAADPAMREQLKKATQAEGNPLLASMEKNSSEHTKLLTAIMRATAGAQEQLKLLDPKNPEAVRPGGK